MTLDKKESIILNIPINSKNIPELQNRIDAFMDEIIGWLQDETEADQVIQLGAHLVPFK